MSKTIAIGIPSYGSLKDKTVQSLFNLKADKLIIESGNDVPHNRNLIAAISLPYDYLLFIDSDMIFDKDLIERLLAHNKDIVGVDSKRRYLPLTTTVSHEGEIPEELFKCEAVGTGIMLIKTSVFYRIEQPYFMHEYTDYGLIKTSEDYNFCTKAQEAGIDIWCDPTIEVKHTGEYEY